MAMTTIAFTCIFNGYLTARPVVLYGRPYQIGRRIGSIPVEDFIYGLALVTFTLVIYENFKRWWPRIPKPAQVAPLQRLRETIHPSYLVQKWVESRLGPYRVRVVEPRPGDAA